MRGRENLSRAIMRLGLGRRESLAAVGVFFGGIAAALKEGRSVTLVGFGSWEWTDRPPRRAHDPRNLKKVELPERRKLVFKPSQTIKRRLNEGKP